MKQRIGMVLVMLFAALMLTQVSSMCDFQGFTSVAQAQSSKESVDKGAALFQKQCAKCHFTDKADTKVGPGLKGLFKLDKLPDSKRPVTEATVQAQLHTPYEDMPAFPDLKGDDLKALMDYLKSL